MRILFWGINRASVRYMLSREISPSFVGFIGSQSQKNTAGFGFPVYTPNEVKAVPFDFIIAFSQKTEEIYSSALQNNIDVHKVFFYYAFEIPADSKSSENKPLIRNSPDISEIVKNALPNLWSDYSDLSYNARRVIKTYRCGYDEIDNEQILLKEGFDYHDYKYDYFRLRTFELVANEIIRNHVDGVCAEFGVFAGVFSRLINKKFSDRALYLFDTFEGFGEEESRKAVENGDIRNVEIEFFKRTDENAVMKRMPYPEKCIIRKGLFPATAEGLEDLRFAFVSMDFDLEESTFSALEFCCPKMNKGGFIFLHDYNNRMFFGIKRAVKRYEEKHGELQKIPIADEGGTLILAF